MQRVIFYNLRFLILKFYFYRQNTLIKKWKGLIEKVKQQISQGNNPKQITHAICAGLFLGIFPVIGATTTLCVIYAYIFKLNHVLIQGINYLVYPLQGLLWIIFLRGGSGILGEKNNEQWSLEYFTQAFQNDKWEFFTGIAWIQLYGVLAWFIFTIFAAPLSTIFISRIVYKTKKPHLTENKPS